MGNVKPMKDAITPAVLFVCLGNICRSPMAEGAFRAAMAQRGLVLLTDSAGTGGWHVGDAPDPRAIAEAAHHGVDISGLRARQIAATDFDRFTHIIAMDADNLATLHRIRPTGSRAALSLMLDYAGNMGQPVADPYYGGPEGFARVWAQVQAGTEGLLDHIAPK